MSIEPRSRAWVEVDIDAVRANYRTIADRVDPETAIIAMVKADGYGLGIERVVRALEPLNPWAYGVATAEEGTAVRDLGVRRPVIVFSPLPPSSVRRAAEARLTACVSDLDALDRWAAVAGEARPLDVHVEVDTGMGRAGFDWRDVARWGPAVRDRTDGALRWTGVFTHFQGADSEDPDATAEQWARFQDVLRRLPGARTDRIVHAANSAAALRWPSYALDAVRPGIFLYGGHPAARLPPDVVPAPRPVATVRARIVRIKDVPAGHSVGYGATYRARGPERWGTLALGYGDGLPRLLSNRGEALVRGRRVPIIGRVSMDLTVVDLSRVPEAEVGDAATLVGRDGDEEITLEQVAGRADTISYEILTGLTPRLPRVEANRATGTA